MNHEYFMEKAVELSLENMRANKGGPFGAIVVKDGKIVGTGSNHVTSENDPTAHAEVVAIRDACKNLGSFQLDDCVLYTSCEPCPMCLGAIYRARPKAVYYANTRTDAAQIQFDDDFIYQELDKQIDQRAITFHQIGRENALKVFEEWTKKQDKIRY
ncbi:MAG: tRNA-specific adenosine deaminase [candidate division SR1 bacterium]|nr:MAG: tRNA-specific adenosine deaminase [candidate division SR1 bacterium]